MRFLSLIGLFLSALSLSSANTLHLGEQLPLRSESTDADTINFLSLGDWGSVNSDQAAVANQMGIAASDSNAAFLLALGDNFYEFGVLTDTDSAWKKTYEDVYNAPSLSIPWYVILGNHDHYSLTAGQAEIDYYKNRRDNRWTLPSNYYTQVFNLTTATGSFTAQIVMIDTVILSGLWHDKLWAFTPRNDALAQTQLQWIESTLAESTADWIFVAGHYPVFSGGEHGDTADLVNNLKPLLEKYNVDAYMSGHDHNLQHLQSGSVNYWLSGNGAKRGSYSAIQQSLFGVVDPGFMLHSLNSTHMHTEIIDLNGNHVYEYTQARVPKTQRYTATA